MGSGRHSSRKKSSSSSSLKMKMKMKMKMKLKRSQDTRKKKSTGDRDTSKKEYSVSTSSVSYTTSDDDLKESPKRRGGRSTATRAKSQKRRPPRILSRSESSEDTSKERKSKRSRKSDARRKHHPKKRRREPCVDCTNTQSYSCSTYGSSDDSAERVERTRVRSEISRTDHKDLYEQTSKNSHRSRSCSCTHSDSESEVEFETAKLETRETSENQPKRLRSVVLVADREPTKVKDEDEVLYEHNDYPSSRTNDSNDVGGLKDSVLLSKSGKLRAEDLKEKNGASTTKLPASGESDGDLGAKHLSSFSEGMVSVQDEILPSNADSKGDYLEAILRQKALENLRKFHSRSDVPRKNDSYHGEVQLPYLKSDSVIGKPVEEGTLRGSLNSDNVGSVKRGGDKSNRAGEGLAVDHQSHKSGAAKHLAVHCLKDNTVITVKDNTGFSTNEFIISSSTSKAVPHEHPKPDNIRPSRRRDFCGHLSSKGLVTTDPLVKDNAAAGAANGKCAITISSPVKEPHGTVKSRNQGPVSAAAPIGGVQEDGHHRSGRQSIIHLSSKRLFTTNSSDHNTTPDPAKYQTNASTTRSNDEPSRTNRTIEQAPALQESPQLRISNPLQRGLKDAVKGSQSVIHDSKVVGEGTSRCEISSSNQNTGDRSTDNERKEGEGSSQFQQKTMSVMRGGELVQVNYKVYIPKKAPALARRQLKR